MVKEWFPVVSALILVGISFCFSLWVAWDVPINPHWESITYDEKLPERSDREEEEETTQMESYTMEIDVDEDIEKQVVQHQKMQKNHRSLSVTDKGKNLQCSDFFNDGIRQENNFPILKWSNITCVYSAKKTGQRNVMALSDSYGELRAGDLMAIMGPR